MAAEALRTGLPIGSDAPDFDLPAADGTRVRLTDLRGEPVLLLHLVGHACPVTRGGVHTMRGLHHRYTAAR